jgi:hypothetical protein
VRNALPSPIFTARFFFKRNTVWTALISFLF